MNSCPRNLTPSNRYNQPEPTDPEEIHPLLKPLTRIEQNGHWPLVDQFHCHHFLKASCLAVQSRGANALHEQFVQLAGLLGLRRRIERRPLAAPHRSEERRVGKEGRS